MNRTEARAQWEQMTGAEQLKISKQAVSKRLAGIRNRAAAAIG